MGGRRCFMIVIAEFTDRQRFLEGYARVVPPLVERFGGRYVIRGAGGAFLEGGWPGSPSALVSEWPDRATAERFWNSPEYAEAKKLREGTGRFQVLIVESDAFPPP
jgi:uncharacterized protein (DUF1330 family)